MSVIRIASRYAKSLLDLAIEQNKVDRILEDIQAFQKSVEVRELYLLLKSPIVNPSKKASILQEIFGKQLDELTMAFINIIINKGREPLLPEIAEAFVQQYREMKNISTIQLTTATPWTEEAINDIRQKLLSDDSQKSEVEIITKVDPKLIGGFVLEFEDKLYDASVAHQLDQLRKSLSAN